MQWQQHFTLKKNPVLQMPATLSVAGRRYVLSDHFPFTYSEGEEQQPSGGGARLIMGPAKKRYLWAYDTDEQTIAAWRVSDGDDKAWGDAKHYISDIIELDRRKQLNRVTHQQFQQLDAFFRRRYQQAVESLKAYAQELSSDWEKQAKRILQDYFNKYVLPMIERRWQQIRQGAHPFGFTVNKNLLRYRTARHQAFTFVADQVINNEFTQLKAYDIVRRRTGIDPYEPPEGDPQAVEWAYQELREEFYERIPNK